MDFQGRAAKLKREQADRARCQAHKVAAEKQAKMQHEGRMRAEEEVRRRQRLAEAARQDELRVQREADAENNRGVVWQGQLRAVPLPESANTKGIHRAADKVLLPPSVGAELMAQGAERNAAPFFEVRTAAGGLTHVSVLDYTAAEGTIGLPLKAVRSLWGADATLESVQGPVQVKYVRLDKGTYVRFQPRFAAFQKDMGDAVGDVLTAVLLQQAALTEGDWLAVTRQGMHHDLKVLQLRPSDGHSAAVSVIDTEMDAEVEPSIETEQRIREEEAASARRAQQLLAIRAEQEAEAAKERRRAEEAVLAAQTAAVNRAAELDAIRQAKRAALPEEPSATATEPVVTCLLRFPDGSGATRRFRALDLLQSLFDFSDAQGSGGAEPGSYRLVAQMPRRILQPSSCGGDMTLQAAGLQQQELLRLEPLPGCQ